MYFIFSFKSRQEAMRLYETAKSVGVPVSVISTPKLVYSGCGLSVKTDYANYYTLYNVYASMRFSSFYGAFRIENTGGTTRSERVL